MQDRSVEALQWLLWALFCGGIAAIVPHPAVKLGATLVAMGAVSKAGECFQVTARESYWQLRTAPEPRQLSQGY